MRCEGFNLNSQRCSRDAQRGEIYCWQHRCPPKNAAEEKKIEIAQNEVTWEYFQKLSDKQQNFICPMAGCKDTRILHNLYCLKHMLDLVSRRKSYLIIQDLPRTNHFYHDPVFEKYRTQFVKMQSDLFCTFQNCRNTRVDRYCLEHTLDQLTPSYQHDFVVLEQTKNLLRCPQKECQNLRQTRNPAGFSHEVYCTFHKHALKRNRQRMLLLQIKSFTANVLFDKNLVNLIVEAAGTYR